MPLTFFLFLKALETESFKHIFLASFSWILLSSEPRFSIWGVMLLFISGFYGFLSFKKSFFQSAKIFLFIVLSYVVLSSYWLIPYIVTSFKTYIGPEYTLSIDMVSALNNQISLLKSMMFRKFILSTPNSYEPLPNYLQGIEPLLLFFTILLPIFVFLTVIIKRDKISIYFASLVTFFIGWSTALSNKGVAIFDWAYTTILFDIPVLSEKFGFVFREPSKFTQFSILFSTLLIGLLIFEILQRCKKIWFSCICICLIIGSIMSASWPLLTGDFNGELRPVKIPKEYIITNDYLKNFPQERRAIWIPDYDSNYFWHDRIVRDFGIANSFISTFWTTPLSGLQSCDALFSWIGFRFSKMEFSYTVIGGEKTKNLGAILAPLGVDFIVLHADSLDVPNDRYVYFLDRQDDLIKEETIGFIKVYKNTRTSEKADVKCKTIWIFGGFESYLSLLAAANLNKTSIVFPEASNEYVPLDIMFPESFVIISDEPLCSLMKSMKILEPYKTSIHHYPEAYWSRASTSDPSYGKWHAYLAKYGMENWQSDYNRGLVFTWAILNLKNNPKPNANDLLSCWTFKSTNELNLFKNYTCENQFGSLYTLTLDNGVLKAELWNSTYGWKTINSPLIPAEYGNWYRWEFQIKTENAYSVHVKIAEYDQNRKVITVKYTKSIGSGTFNWQTVTIDYTPENPETKYIQLQIWHGHETTQPLPNRIWIDNVKIYDLKRFVEPVVLEIPFTIEENGEYVFLTRLFQNQRGGKIQIQLDNKNYIINTKDQLNKFVWKEIDTIRLEKGSHKIILTNLKGFNAVNLFALIPKQEYQKAQKQIEEILQDKRIIYILEAETDLYYQNATISNKYCGNASNGQVLQLNQASRVYSEIEIIKPGNYAIAIRAKGNLTIKIDEKEYKISSPQLNWTYIRPIYLERGKHKIEITNLKDQLSDLDVVWLYSIQNENETLEDIFTVKEIPAEVISYRKIDPTKYVVKVNATKPFMLSFAESYDPLWVAYINREKIQSIPLYDVINGFWINQTGLLEITIEYEPQKWFYYGSGISFLTLTGCVLYLAKKPLYRLVSKIRKLKLTL
jgi:hypothetical protein